MEAIYKCWYHKIKNKNWALTQFVVKIEKEKKKT